MVVLQGDVFIEQSGNADAEHVGSRSVPQWRCRVHCFVSHGQSTYGTGNLYFCFFHTILEALGSFCVSSQGDYELAAEILRSAEERFPENTQHAHVWILCQQLQNFTKALHHGKHDAAQNAIANMAAIDELQAAYWSVPFEH